MNPYWLLELGKRPMNFPSSNKWNNMLGIVIKTISYDHNKDSKFIYEVFIYPPIKPYKRAPITDMKIGQHLGITYIIKLINYLYLYMVLLGITVL